MRSERIWWKHRQCMRYHSRISRADTLLRWDDEYPRLLTRCICGYPWGRTSNHKRGRDNGRYWWVWAIYRAHRATQDALMIYIRKWDRTRCSWNRDFSPPRNQSPRYIWWRTHKDSSREDTALKTKFSPPRWADKLHRPPKPRMAREIPHRNLEMMIYHRISWPRISRQYL